MLARIHIMLKPGVLDPQGQAIGRSLGHLGFDGIKAIRQGKFIDVELDATDPAQAKTTAEAMCQKLLANTVIENYRVEVL